MKRREALQLVGTGIAAGIVGCSSRSDDGNSTATLTPEPTACPEVPAYLEPVDFNGDQTVVCNHSDSSDQQDPSLVANPQTTSLPDATVEFLLRNRREEAYTTNFYQWSLYKRVGGRWYSVVPRRISGNGVSTLGPGKTHSWTFSIDNSSLSEPVEPVHSDGGKTTVRGLGGGTYAFLVPGSYEDVSCLLCSDKIVSYAVQFEIDGPALDLVPPNTVSEVSRTGDTIEITVGNSGPTKKWILTRTTETPARQENHERVITEQLYGRPALRSALAYLVDGVERVVVRSGHNGFAPRRSVTFDGTRYRVKSRVLMDE